jgi:trypsin
LSPGGPAAGPTVESRIVGGTAEHVKTYPFFAAITYYGSFYCGGSIISIQFVLSAAHCFQGHTIVNPFAVYVGISKFSAKSSNDKFDVAALILHSSYDTNTFQADIAILKLKNPIPEWTDFIQPACIKYTSEAEIESGVTVKAVGMGATSETKQKESDFLLSVPIKTMTAGYCNALFGANYIKDDMVCAGDVSGGKDACQGDSGGPLVQTGAINGSEVEYLIGTVSFGIGCARADMGAAYASVHYYQDWIHSTINHFQLNY